MGSEVGEELHYRDLVHSKVNGNGKEEPDGRKEDEKEKESGHFRGSPVQSSVPDLLEVLLHHIFCDHHLLLVVDQDINELGVLVVRGVEDCSGTVDVTCSDDKLPGELLAEVGGLLEVRGALLLRLSDVSVDRRQLGCYVARCGCKEDELLNSFPIFTLGLDQIMTREEMSVPLPAS